MSDCDSNSNSPNSEDCDGCQKTLKNHLSKCADYGKLPKLIEKCSDLPGGCSVGKPDSCPAPPPPPEEACTPPTTCNTPTTTFTCPTSDCGNAAAAPAPKQDFCAPPQTQVDQCLPVKKPECGGCGTATCGKSTESGASGTSTNDNSCEVKPLSMNKQC